MDVQSLNFTEFETLKKSRNFPAALALILNLLKKEPASQRYLVEAAFICKEMIRRLSCAYLSRK